MEMFIGFLYGVCATLAGGLAAHFLSKEREYRSEFNKAATAFRAAFVETQRLLDESKNFDFVANGVETRNILFANIVEHEKAKIIFSSYLSTTELPGFNKAWKEYYSQETRNSECLGEYKSIQHEIVLKLAIRSKPTSRTRTLLCTSERIYRQNHIYLTFLTS